MGKLNLWLGTVCGVLAVAFPLLAQTGSETLVQSVDWLKKNLGGAACVVFRMGPAGEDLKAVTENTEVRFSGCDMTLETATTIGPRSELRTFLLPLGKLNSTAVTLIEGFKIPSGWMVAGEVPAYTIRLVAPSGDAIDATLEQFGADAPQPSRYSTTEVNILLLRHKETAEKIVTALSRAIALCRVK